MSWIGHATSSQWMLDVLTQRLTFDEATSRCILFACGRPDAGDTWKCGKSAKQSRACV
jgi:hypothetical protein